MTLTTTRRVLITDLRKSTDLRVRIGDRAFDALRREHDRLLGEAAVAHGGEVVKGQGDGIIALFGAAHEAIAARVTMQQGIDRLNSRSADELELAIGISAGDVALHFEAAIEFEDGLGARVLATRSRLALAELLVDTDAARAQSYAREAHDTANALGTLQVVAGTEAIITGSP